MLIASFALLAQADVLTLRDGTVLRGRVIDEGDRTVIFRIELGEAGSLSREFLRSQIRRIERGDGAAEEAASQPASEGAAGAKAATKPARKVEPPRSMSPVARDAYFEQMMREGFELLDDQDEEAALRAFQRLAQRAPESLLKRLDALCQSLRGVALPRLMAQLRMKQAQRDDDTGKIDLGFATRYEAAELGQLLEARYEEILDQVHEGRSLRSWAAKPDEFPAKSREAGAAVRGARAAIGLISARLRQDRALSDDREKRAKLISIRDQLGRFATQVGGAAGGRTTVDEIRELTDGPRKKGDAAEAPDTESEPESGDGSPPLDSDPTIWNRGGAAGPRSPASAPAREPPPLGDAP